LHAQRLSWAKEFFLADEFIERAGAHAFRERLIGGLRGGFGGRLLHVGKEAHDLLGAPRAAGVEMRLAGKVFLWRAAS